MAVRSFGKPWFNGVYEGIGLMLPIAWQGWVVLATGVAVMLASLAVPQGAVRDTIFFGAMFGLIAIIYAKRTRD